MRIAYLSFEHPDGSSGVSKKINSQVNEWKKHNHDVKHFCLSSDGKFIPNNTARFFLNLSCFKKRLKEYKPDLIYMREVLYVPGLISLLNCAPYCVEINSDAYNEYKSSSFFKSLYYFVTKNRLLSHAAGLVFVTHELKKRLNKNNFSSSSIVISNSYDLESVPQKRRSVENEKAVLVYVSNPAQPWTNKEELKRIVEALPNYRFILIGGDFEVSGPNVSSFGVLGAGEVKNHLLEADIGIGTLGLFRKKMEEACPLKVREYIAFGLPVILPYKDTDLSGFGEKDGVLSIENENKSFLENIEKIKKFVETWKGRRLSNDLVKESISLSKKEQDRLSFFQEVLQK